jgi:SAM-dependent methyltransferase
MDDLPFADATFDWVWACQVLHHNPPERLEAALREAHRVLKPGGALLVANEPLLTARQPRNVVEDWVEEFEGEEHAYWRFQYVRAARRAGFTVEVRGPWYHRLFQWEPITISHRMGTWAVLRAALHMVARRQSWITKPYLAARSYLIGGTALHMVCRKPR